jgi:hypothetical protein
MFSIDFGLCMHIGRDKKWMCTFDWATHVLQLRDFLGARILADMGVLQRLHMQAQ